jgi:hypothetical protein
MTKVLARGDYVRLRIPETGSTVTGMVILAVKQSHIVMYDGALRLASGGLLVGMAALSIDYETQTVTVLPTGEPVEIDVADLSSTYADAE